MQCHHPTPPSHATPIQLSFHPTRLFEIHPAAWSLLFVAHDFPWQFHCHWHESWLVVLHQSKRYRKSLCGLKNRCLRNAHNPVDDRVFVLPLSHPIAHASHHHIFLFSCNACTIHAPSVAQQHRS